MSMADPSSFSKKSLLILYGTETGNALDLAQLLARKCERLCLKPNVRSMDDYPVVELPLEEIVVFICATTGQGELPRNCKKFWRYLLQKKLPPTFLSGVNFSSFGLGDSSYPKFNWAVRKLHRRILQLGAHEFSHRGEGDDQNSDGVEQMYHEWESKICENLLKLAPLEEGESIIPENTLMPPRYRIDIHSNKFKYSSEDALVVATSRNEISVGKIVLNRRMTSKDHFQDVRNFTFECEDSALQYGPGDTVALYPSNDPEDVQALLDHQGWSHLADAKVTVNKSFEQSILGGLVSPLTLRSLLQHHLDINSIPRRSFFGLVWHFSSNDREKERLKEFSEIENLQDLYDYANRPRRSIVEAVTEFESLKIPVEYVLDVFPILRPRLFSIASPSPIRKDGILTSSQNSTDLTAPDNDSHISQVISFTLAIAIVKYKTILHRIRRGVCTRWIETLEKGDKIPFTLHKSEFKLGNNKPMIMIAPGTGVAPMRSLILTRIQSTSKATSSNPMMLFFGCRYREKDYLFQEDWKPLIENNQIQVITAFSRDPGGYYVQEALYKNKQQVANLLAKGAIVYLCGSSGKMPTQVRITLSTILQETQGWTEQEATSYIMNMESKGRYIQETW